MKFEPDVIYVWVGGSCDYGHKERAGGGAYIAEIYTGGFGGRKKSDSTIIGSYTCSEFGTTEFKMIFAAMDHALNIFRTPADSSGQKLTNRKIIFLSNVQYILNFERPENVDIKILPYHKYPQQQKVHEMASEAMQNLRKSEAH